jgi:hypothetical protein
MTAENEFEFPEIELDDETKEFLSAHWNRPKMRRRETDAELEKLFRGVSDANLLRSLVACERIAEEAHAFAWRSPEDYDYAGYTFWFAERVAREWQRRLGRDIDEELGH